MFIGSYLDWNQKKIKAIMDHYGHQFFVHKKVLDLGCGHGDIGGVLHRLGADVTGVDARQEHLKMVSKKYAGVKTVRADLDGPWPFYGKTFDLTIDIGLLCHLKDFEAHLRAVCASSTCLILETAVLDSNETDGLIVKPDKNNSYDSSFNGFNSQISAANIERVLTACGMSFKRMDKAKLNSGNYIYDWQSSFNNSYDSNKRRLWFCINAVSHSQTVISSSKIVTELPAINPGVFSQHLVNSKVPATYKPIVTSKSPAPPNTPPIISTTVIDDIKARSSKEHSVFPGAVAIHKPAPNYKIAVLISGHLRVFEKTINSVIRHLLNGDRDRADFFIHTWETLGAPGSKENMDASLNGVPTESKMKQIIATYNPKSLMIEKSSIHGEIYNHANNIHLTAVEKSGFYGGEIFNYTCMLFSWKQVFEMMEAYERENDTKYDMIIKYRPDIIFPDKLEILNQNINAKTLYVPNIAYYYNNGINDQFAYGDHDTMKIYCSLYHNQIDYMNRKVINPLRPETLLKYHIANHNILARPVGMRYYLLRSNGNILYPHGANMPMSTDYNLIAHLV